LQPVPTAANVPQVQVQPDPGLPALVAPRGAFGGQIGAGLEVAGNVAARIGIENLRDAERAQRLKADRDFTEFLSGVNADVLQKTDLTSDNEVNAVKSQVDKKASEVLSNFQGSQQGRTLLTDRIERRRIAFFDKLAVAKVTAKRTRRSNDLQKGINSVLSSVEQDAAVVANGPGAPDVVDVFKKHSADLQDQLIFQNTPPDLFRGAVSAGNLAIAKSMIDALIQEGDTTRAQRLINSERLHDVLPPQARRDFAERINRVERAMQKDDAKIAQAREIAKLELGNSATQDQIDARAGQILEGSKGFHIIQTTTGDVIGIDPHTGAARVLIEGPSAQELADRAAAVETAKQTARTEVLGRLFKNLGIGTGADSGASQVDQRSGVGATPQSPSDIGGQAAPTDPETAALAKGQEPPSVAQPFADTQERPTNDMKDAMRLFVAARGFMLAGQTQMANSILSQARFLVDNSAEIRKSRELDKTLSVQAAAALGVGVGTTVRDALGKIPPSLEQQAESRARGTAFGKGQIEAKQTIRFIDSGLEQTANIISKIEADPSLVGVTGSLRKTGQTVVQVLGDLGARNLVQRAKNIALSDADLTPDQFNGLFNDPTLSTLDIIQNSLGITLARVLNPKNRVPVEIIKRSIDSVALTGLESSKQVLDRLRFVQRFLKDQKARLQRDFRLGEAEPTFRIENGKAVPTNDAAKRIFGGQSRNPGQ